MEWKLLFSKRQDNTPPFSSFLCTSRLRLVLPLPHFSLNSRSSRPGSSPGFLATEPARPIAHPMWRGSGKLRPSSFGGGLPPTPLPACAYPYKLGTVWYLSISTYNTYNREVWTIYNETTNTQHHKRTKTKTKHFSTSPELLVVWYHFSLRNRRDSERFALFYGTIEISNNISKASRMLRA